LLAMDVPDHMSAHREKGIGRQLTPKQLLALVHMPLKMLQIISEGISTAYDVHHLSNKQKLGAICEVGSQGDRMNKRTQLEERTLSGDWTATKEKEGRHLKAEKNDNACVPMELWEEYLLRPFPRQTAMRLHPGWSKALRVLQQFGLQMWRCDKLCSYVRWKHKNKDKSAEFMSQAHEAASDALQHAMLATWWDWPNGSWPFFWNWLEEIQTQVMVGLKWWLCDGFVPFKKKQKIL